MKISITCLTIVLLLSPEFIIAQRVQRCTAKFENEPLLKKYERQAADGTLDVSASYKGVYLMYGLALKYCHCHASQDELKQMMDGFVGNRTELEKLRSDIPMIPSNPLYEDGCRPLSEESIGHSANQFIAGQPIDFAGSSTSTTDLVQGNTSNPPVVSRAIYDFGAQDMVSAKALSTNAVGDISELSSPNGKLERFVMRFEQIKSDKKGILIVMDFTVVGQGNKKVDLDVFLRYSVDETQDLSSDFLPTLLSKIKVQNDNQSFKNYEVFIPYCDFGFPENTSAIGHVYVDMKTETGKAIFSKDAHEFVYKRVHHPPLPPENVIKKAIFGKWISEKTDPDKPSDYEYIFNEDLSASMKISSVAQGKTTSSEFPANYKIHDGVLDIASKTTNGTIYTSAYRIVFLSDKELIIEDIQYHFSTHLVRQ